MDLLMPWLETHMQNTNPFLFGQMMVVFGLVWWKLKPHLIKIEARFEGIEVKLGEMNETVTKGFAQGEIRFANLEHRVETLETK